VAHSPSRSATLDLVLMLVAGALIVLGVITSLI